jgi:PIN domain nuclease of toxin-antitoxin system
MALRAPILLDTHTLIWWALDDRRLPARVRRRIENRASEVVVSAATAWEIATKVRLRRLSWAVSTSVREYALGQGFSLLAVSFEHAERAGSWPQDHGDPFDRMLAAQSAIERMPLATNDPQMATFGIETTW